MATPTELNAATKDVYDSTDPGDIIFKASPLFYLLMRGSDGNYSVENFKNSLVDPSTMSGGGNEHRFPLEFALANNGPLGDTTVVDTSYKQIYTYGYEKWGSAWTALTIFHSEDITNYTPGQVFDLVAKKVLNAQKSAQDQIAKAVLQFGVRTGDVSGVASGYRRLQSALCDLFDPAAATTTAYLGIQENDVAQWAGNQDQVARTMTLATLQYMARTAKVDATVEGQPNLYLCSQTLLDSFEQGLQTQQQFRDVKALETGWYNIMFRNAPVMAEIKMDANADDVLARTNTVGSTGRGSTSVIGLNTRHLALKIHKGDNFRMTDWMSDKNEAQNKSASMFSSQMLTTDHRAAHIWSDNVSAA